MVQALLCGTVIYCVDCSVCYTEDLNTTDFYRLHRSCTGVFMERMLKMAVVTPLSSFCRPRQSPHTGTNV